MEEKEKDEIKKQIPFDVMVNDEVEKLSSEIIGALNSSVLPVSIKKLAFQKVYIEVVKVFDDIIDRERQNTGA